MEYLILEWFAKDRSAIRAVQTAYREIWFLKLGSLAELVLSIVFSLLVREEANRAYKVNGGKMLCHALVEKSA